MNISKYYKFPVLKYHGLIKSNVDSRYVSCKAEKYRGLFPPVVRKSLITSWRPMYGNSSLPASANSVASHNPSYYAKILKQLGIKFDSGDARQKSPDILTKYNELQAPKAVKANNVKKFKVSYKAGLKYRKHVGYKTPLIQQLTSVFFYKDNYSTGLRYYCKDNDPCKPKKKKKEGTCKPKKSDLCKPRKKKAKKDPCKTEKEDPCKRKKKEAKKDPCKKEKEDPCKGKKKEAKKDPCKKEKEDPCKGKEKEAKQDPCKREKEDPCKRKKKEAKKDPCKREKEDPCKRKKKRAAKDPCKVEKDPCKSKSDGNKCKTWSRDPPPKEDSSKSDKDDPCKPKKDPCKN